MNAILKHLQDPKFTAKVHLWLMVLWTVLIIPTFLWWSQSIFWVLLISIYANLYGLRMIGRHSRIRQQDSRAGTRHGPYGRPLCRPSSPFTQGSSEVRISGTLERMAGN